MAAYGLPVEATLAAYRAAHPGASPGDLFAAIQTDWYWRIPAIRLADAHAPRPRIGAPTCTSSPGARRSSADASAPATRWRYPSSSTRSATRTEPLLGADPPQALADAMHGAWVAFAATGDPGWPRYDLEPQGDHALRHDIAGRGRSSIVRADAVGSAGLTGRDRRQRSAAPRSSPSAYDQHCLRVETPARPLQVGILAVLDGRALVDPSGRLRLADIRREIDGRVAGVPELRRIVFRPGPLAGRPLWVDDPAFRIDRHVGEVELSPPGDEAALLALAEQLMARPLDRSRPLWRMWFATGLEDGRVGVLVVLHHALADGLTAMRLVRSLLEPPMAFAGGRRHASAGRGRGGPTALERARPRQRQRPRSSRRCGSPVRPRGGSRRRRACGPAAPPPRPAGSADIAQRAGRAARRLATVRLDLLTAKRVARAHDCGVNDVVLGLVTGGVRALLAGRGEPIELLRPRAGIAVALFSPGHGTEAGNDIGTLHVPLPIGEADPRPGCRSSPVSGPGQAEPDGGRRADPPGVVRALRRVPARARPPAARQPRRDLPARSARPIDVLGAPVLDLLPIAPLAGNLGLSFVALSYAGRLEVAVRVDANQFPTSTCCLPPWSGTGRPCPPR